MDLCDGEQFEDGFDAHKTRTSLDATNHCTNNNETDPRSVDVQQSDDVTDWDYTKWQNTLDKEFPDFFPPNTDAIGEETSLPLDSELLTDKEQPVNDTQRADDSGYGDSTLLHGGDLENTTLDDSVFENSDEEQASNAACEADKSMICGNTSSDADFQGFAPHANVTGKKTSLNDEMRRAPWNTPIVNSQSAKTTLSIWPSSQTPLQTKFPLKTAPNKLKPIMYKPPAPFSLVPRPKNSTLSECSSEKTENSVNRSVKKKKRQLPGAVIMKWIQQTEDRKPCLLPVDLPRPDLSYLVLSCLALRNSPDNRATLNEICCFIMHHFRYYRFAIAGWKNNTRCALTERVVIREKTDEDPPVNYYKLPEDFQWNQVLRHQDQLYMQEDTRGVEFFNRMMAGDVGMPRQLFYHVVCHHMPCFAGPENSALFYHLLAVKQPPNAFDPLFREYWHQEHSGNEPKFVESRRTLDMGHLTSIDKECGFGEALEDGKDKDGVEMTTEELIAFHDNIDEYFRLQKKQQEKGIATWKTPKHADVEKHVLSGNAPNTYILPRDFNDLPRGSLYRDWKPLDGIREPLHFIRTESGSKAEKPRWYHVGESRSRKFLAEIRRKKGVKKGEAKKRILEQNRRDAGGLRKRLFGESFDDATPPTTKVPRVDSVASSSSSHDADTWTPMSSNDFISLTPVKWNTSTESSVMSPSKISIW